LSKKKKIGIGSISSFKAILHHMLLRLVMEIPMVMLHLQLLAMHHSLLLILGCAHKHQLRLS
jgi:hypothetical protein